MSYQTPFSQELTPGNYRINMPSPVTDASGIYIFTRWQDGNTQNPRTINLQTDFSLIAEYTKQTGGPYQGQTPFLLTLDEGTYTINMPINVVVGSDTYRFKQWEDGSTNPIRQITLNQNLSLRATYELTTVILNIAAGANGSVNPSGAQTLNVGQAYSFNAVSNVGYLIDHWDLDGTNIGSTNPLSLTATVDLNNKLLTAIFTAIPPVQINLNMKITGEGVTTPSSGTQTFNVGDIIQFSAIPNSGFAFKQWTFNGSIYTDNPLSLTITEDMNGKTLTAEFTGPPAPLTSSLLIIAIPVAIIGGYFLLKGKR